MTKPIKTAVIIDDIEIDQEMYRRILAKSGLAGQVLAFTYAEDALSFLTADPAPDVDVIFLDINMPRMDGFEFLDAASAKLGQEFGNMFVAMLTTSLNPKDEARAKNYDAVKTFIRKPLRLEHIQQVADLLGRQ